MRIGGFETRLRERIKARIDEAAQTYLYEGQPFAPDFTKPVGEPSLASPDSVSWRIFKNPVSLFIGGVAAVILELAEPRVRTGIWERSSFRTDPKARLKRTGLAAMVTVYGARSVAEKMIAGVNRMHGRIAGVTPSGAPYSAADPELLNWVQATASFGFLESYHAYVSPLTDADRDRFYRDAQNSAALYGAVGAPGSVVEQRALFAAMAPMLEASPIIFEFLGIMRNIRALPAPRRLFQRPLVRAAVEITPPAVRDVLGLDARYGLRPFEGAYVRRIARRAERIMLRTSPAVEACERVGLPADYLYQKN